MESEYPLRAGFDTNTIAAYAQKNRNDINPELKWDIVWAPYDIVGATVSCGALALSVVAVLGFLVVLALTPIFGLWGFLIAGILAILAAVTGGALGNFIEKSTYDDFRPVCVITPYGFVVQESINTQPTSFSFADITDLGIGSEFDDKGVEVYGLRIRQGQSSSFYRFPANIPVRLELIDNKYKEYLSSLPKDAGNSSLDESE